MMSLHMLAPFAATMLCQADPPAGHVAVVQDFVETWCIDCHRQPRPRAELDLQVLLERLDDGERPASLSRIVERLDARDMPPDGEPVPDEGAYDDAIFALESLVDAPGDPARTTARRLSRYEYGNTVRDLLGVQVDVDDRLPVDEIADGFDNSGDVLSVSPLLLEKYLAIAEECARIAIPSESDQASTTRRFEGRQLRATRRGRSAGTSWILTTRGEIVVDADVHAPGEYILRAGVRGKQAGPEPVRMSLMLGDEVLRQFVVKSPRTVVEVIEIPIELAEGRHTLGVRFVNDYYQPQAEDPEERDRNAYVDWIELEGPHRSAYPSHVQARLLDTFGGIDGDGVLPAMVELLASQAWRRPAGRDDVDRLLALSHDDDPAWMRLRLAVTAMLVHPRFLFRIEEDDPSGGERMLDDWEIASRLSYFLWATMPDEALREAAARGELVTSEGRRRQLERMIQDDRSRALARHFATQWLQIRALSEKAPDETLFPGVDEDLLMLMQEETVRFFDELLRDRRSIDRLLDANWTWVNEQLAVHYGIDGVRGARMRKVSLEGEQQATGILRHGSVLLSTSNPTRTSPVKRGKWILEALLDDAPPPPPPGISGLPEDGKVTGEMTLREMMIQHRTDPQCAGCHVRMDALGFALEEFDAVGRRRATDGGLAIDATGELPDGSLIEGGIGLRDSLLEGESRRRFRRSLAMHMGTYALGRGLDRHDEPMLDAILEELEADPTLYRLILELIESRAFLYRPGDTDAMMDTRSDP